MNSAENVSDERLAEMLQLAQHCRHGEFAALVEQRDIARALAELQALRSPPTEDADRAEPVAFRTIGPPTEDEEGNEIAPKWVYSERPLRTSEPLYASPRPETVVSDAMVERAIDVWFAHGVVAPKYHPQHRVAMRAALTAALSTQEP